MGITFVNIEVICISSELCELSNRNGMFQMDLTKGKIYYATEYYEYSDGTSYCIINDKGFKAAYSTKHFKTLDEIRDERIKKILNE